MLEARTRAAELGVDAVSPGTGALLAVLAASLPGRAVVDVGTGAGVAALRMLEAMPENGVLTSIDVEVEHQGAARVALQAAGVRGNRARIIHGDAADVLPRLADGGYDLVHVDVDDPRVSALVLTESLRLLRVGGVLVVSDALAHDRVPDPAQRDQRTTAARELLGPWPRTTGWSAAWSPWATACCWPSSAEGPRGHQATRPSRLARPSPPDAPRDRTAPARQAGGLTGRVVGRGVTASWAPQTTALRASPSSPASAGVISTTRRPPPSSGTRMTIPRPSLVTSKGPSPVRGFIAAIQPLLCCRGRGRPPSRGRPRGAVGGCRGPLSPSEAAGGG